MAAGWLRKVRTGSGSDRVDTVVEDLGNNPGAIETVRKVRRVRKNTNMIATQYSTASEATGCRHSTTVLRVLAIIECRHPVASLAVLYWVATPIE